jgi:hypothetical protein
VGRDVSEPHVRSIIATIADFVKRHRDHIWRGFVLMLIAWSGYNVGVISARHGAIPAQEAALFRPRTVIVSQTTIPSGKGMAAPKTGHSDPRVVASKTSKTKKYHYSWCPGASQIKEANRIWFPTAQDAQRAGYSLAGNCSE